MPNTDQNKTVRLDPDQTRQLTLMAERVGVPLQMIARLMLTHMLSGVPLPEWVQPAILATREEVARENGRLLAAV